MEKEPSDVTPWLLRIPFWIRALTAAVIMTIGIVLAIAVHSAFLMLMIPAMLLVSERGVM